MDTQCLFVWLQGHLHTQRALTPPPSSSVIGLLWDRAARWQIWIQGNRKGGMDRGGGDKERGAVHYFVPSLSLSFSVPGQDGKAYPGRGGNMSWEVMTQPRRRIHILSDSQVCCSLLLLPLPLLLFLHPTEERERAKDSWHSLPPPLLSLFLSFSLLFVDDGILIMWKVRNRKKRGEFDLYLFSFLYVCVLTVWRCGLSQREFFLE